MLPIKIKIANHIFSVKKMDAQWGRDSGRFGDCTWSTLTIRLDTSVPVSHLKETLLHEIMHAVCDAYNILDSDREERVVSQMAAGMSQVLQDNKKLREFLLES